MMAYEDSVGKRPGIDTIKDAVCTQKLRPQILPAWRNHPVSDRDTFIWFDPITSQFLFRG